MSFSSKYVRLLQTRLRFVIMGAWLLGLSFGAWKTFDFINATNMKFVPADSSDAVIALHQFERYFPGEGGLVSLVLLMQRTSGQTVLGNDTQAFTMALYEDFYTDGIYFSASLPFRSYYTMQHLGLQAEADMFVNPTGDWSYMLIAIDDGPTMTTDQYATYFENLVNKHAPHFYPNGGISLRVTGDPALNRDLQQGLENDMLVCDGIAFPLAMLIFGITLQSIRLLIIPVVTIGTSLLTTFLLMFFVSKTVDVVNVAPSLMLSTTIAMCIDYSLFLLSRYQEELIAGSDLTNALTKMMESSGHTVLVSGITLSLCFAGLLLFPMQLLSSLGVGCGLAVAVAVLVNLSLTPCLLITFDKFFSNITKPMRFRCCKNTDGQDEYAALMKSAQQDDYGSNYSTNSSSAGSAPLTDIRTSRWYRFGTVLLRHPYVVVFVVCAIVAYPTYVGITFRYTLNSLSFAPRDSQTTVAFGDMDDVFGGGRMYPYSLLLQPTDGQLSTTYTIFNETFYNNSHTFINQLLAMSPPGTFVYSLAYYPTMTFANLSYCLSLPTATNCSTVNQLLARYASPLCNCSIFADIYLGVDPTGPSGLDWLDQVRSLIASTNSDGFTHAALADGVTYAYDTINVAYKAFPMALGVTTAVVFVIVGAAFRSLVIPVRCIISIAMTLGLVYGLAAFVYEDNILNFLKLGGVHGWGALYWLPPILSFSILVGLGLDYDIFLLTRIIESRKEGLTDNGSILMGLAHTGRIITAAGGIMAVAFFGLLFSNSSILNQLSFYLVIAVLVDTLIVRTLVVPALMSIGGKANWWPSKMPAAYLDSETASGYKSSRINGY